MYKIAVRTYKRNDMFVERTYAFLKNQNIDLENCLYIFVANEDEKKLYQQSLSGQKYKEIVVGCLGLKEVTDFMLDYFGDGQEVFFMDDDLFGFFEFDLNGKLNKDATNLGDYLNKAFELLHKEGISSFCFRNMQNWFYISGAPDIEIRPYFVYGGAFGIIVNKKLHSSTYAHAEDSERTANVIEKDGGTLLFNKAGMITHSGKKSGYGTNDGGMQESGDRADLAARKEFTKKITEELYENTLIGKFFKEPFYNEQINAYDFKLKTLTSLKKYGITRKII